MDNFKKILFFLIVCLLQGCDRVYNTKTEFIPIKIRDSVFESIYVKGTSASYPNLRSISLTNLPKGEFYFYHTAEKPNRKFIESGSFEKINDLVVKIRKEVSNDTLTIPIDKPIAFEDNYFFFLNNVEELIEPKVSFHFQRLHDTTKVTIKKIPINLISNSNN